MSEKTDAGQASGGEAVAAGQEGQEQAQEASGKRAPRNDAEAAQQEAEGKDGQQATQQEGQQDADKARKDEEQQREKQRNRTKAYIDRINGENAELRRRVAEYEASQQRPAQVRTQPQGADDDEPTPEQYGYDPIAFQRAHSQWAVQKAMAEHQQKSQQAESLKRQQEIQSAYAQRASDFAEDHPDFAVVAGSIPFQLSDEALAAIMAHELGPQIAYHLGTDEDAAFALASTLPHMAEAAVARLASRLTAAPQEVQQPTPPAQRPVTQAPAPSPRVTGRSPTETPPEKLTDDEWLKREQERRRKR